MCDNSSLFRFFGRRRASDTKILHLLRAEFGGFGVLFGGPEMTKCDFLARARIRPSPSGGGSKFFAERSSRAPRCLIVFACLRARAGICIPAVCVMPLWRSLLCSSVRLLLLLQKPVGVWGWFCCWGPRPTAVWPCRLLSSQPTTPNVPCL